MSAADTILALPWQFLRQGVELQSWRSDDLGNDCPGPHEMDCMVGAVPVGLAEVHLNMSAGVGGDPASIITLTEADMLRIGQVIAAAPSMLVALQQIAKAKSAPLALEYVQGLARAAIALTGETQ